MLFLDSFEKIRWWIIMKKSILLEMRVTDCAIDAFIFYFVVIAGILYIVILLFCQN